MNYFKTGVKLFLVNLLTMLILVIPYFLFVFFGVIFGLTVMISLMFFYLALSLLIGGWICHAVWKWR
jgi:hypothetical protein